MQAGGAIPETTNILSLILQLYLFYVYGCFVNICMPAQKTVLDSLGPVTDGCEPRCGCWESNLTLQAQSALSTAQPSFKLYKQIFCYEKCTCLWKGKI